MDRNKIKFILNKQLSNFWGETYQEQLINETIEEALDKCFFSFSKLALSRCYNGKKVIFSPYDTVQWAVFLYYLSNLLWKKSYLNEATVVYYLNKIMHSVEWFYEIELPVHFFAEHPHNSILGKARYGDYFFCFHGTTVGANYKDDGSPVYPRLGDNVFMCANSSILGDSSIGNNVIISANTHIKNMNIPDNSIVFGNSLNNGGVFIKQMSEFQIKRRTSKFWRWDI